MVSNIRCRVQKRDKNPPIGYEQLKPPFRNIATFVGVPKLNWESFLKKNFGPGEFLVTVYGLGVRGTMKIWHGMI